MRLRSEQRWSAPFGDLERLPQGQCTAEGYYFAARVEPDFETLASESVPSPSMVSGFNPSDSLVFRWDVGPQDGDVVFVKAVRRQRPERRITRLIEWLYVRSLRMEHLLDRSGLRPRHEPTDREYLVRRFHSEGTPNLDDGTGFRLETLDGRGEVSAPHRTRGSVR